jgi:hypothetical protein
MAVVNGHPSLPPLSKLIALRWRLRLHRWRLLWRARSTLLDKLAIAALALAALELVIK